MRKVNKKDIITALLDSINEKEDILSIFIVGSNGVNTDIIDSNKDLDFVFVVKDSVNIFIFSRFISEVIWKLILLFKIPININPIKKSIYDDEPTTFVRNIKSRNEKIWDNGDNRIY